MLNETLMEKYLRECAAFEAKYPAGNFPKEEKKALDKLYIAAVNESPEDLAVAIAANRDTVQSSSDKALLYGVKPAVTEEPGFDGRRAA